VARTQLNACLLLLCDTPWSELRSASPSSTPDFTSGCLQCHSNLLAEAWSLSSLFERGMSPVETATRSRSTCRSVANFPFCLSIVSLDAKGIVVPIAANCSSRWQAAGRALGGDSSPLPPNTFRIDGATSLSTWDPSLPDRRWHPPVRVLCVQYGDVFLPNRGPRRVPFIRDRSLSDPDILTIGARPKRLIHASAAHRVFSSASLARADPSPSVCSSEASLSCSACAIRSFS